MLAHDGIIAEGKLRDESVRVGFHARFPHELQLFLWGCILMRGAKETILDVLADSSGKEYWFLRHKADLGSEPLQVQVTNIQAIEAHRPSKRIIEAFDKRDDGRFP